MATARRPRTSRSRASRAASRSRAASSLPRAISSNMAAAISGATLSAMSSCICLAEVFFFARATTVPAARFVRTGRDAVLPTAALAFGRLVVVFALALAAAVAAFFSDSEERRADERALLLVEVLLLPTERLPDGTLVPL